MNFTKKIYNLTIDIKNYLNKLNKELHFKTRKTTINDAFIFKLLYTMNNSTQENITTRMNFFNKNDASRTSYIKRIDSIDVSIFENFNNYFNERINYYFYNNNNEYTIYAVDGTYIQLKEALSKECKRTKNDGSVTCLLTGLFNVTYNEPTLLKFENNQTSEKKSFEYIFDKFKVSEEKQIFVFDRGYVNYNLFNEINNSKKYFIARVKKNTKNLDSSKEDQIIESKNILKLRYIKYIINDNERRS